MTYQSELIPIFDKGYEGKYSERVLFDIYLINIEGTEKFWIGSRQLEKQCTIEIERLSNYSWDEIVTKYSVVKRKFIEK